jgi:hypothetical protein
MRRQAVRAALSCWTGRKKTAPDPICRVEPLTEAVQAKSGEGAVQVSAPVEEYYYVLDAAGTQLASRRRLG